MISRSRFSRNEGGTYKTKMVALWRYCCIVTREFLFFAACNKKTGTPLSRSRRLESATHHRGVINLQTRNKPEPATFCHLSSLTLSVVVIVAVIVIVGVAIKLAIVVVISYSQFVIVDSILLLHVPGTACLYAIAMVVDWHGRRQCHWPLAHLSSCLRILILISWCWYL